MTVSNIFLVFLLEISIFAFLLFFIVKLNCAIISKNKEVKVISSEVPYQIEGIKFSLLRVQEKLAFDSLDSKFSISNVSKLLSDVLIQFVKFKNPFLKLFMKLLNNNKTVKSFFKYK